jgi:membrane protein DedA with SNARE-associated domain
MKDFTLVDYSAFGLWILLSIILSYLLVRKLKFFGGGYKSQKILSIGLIAGHLLYLVWKKLWLLDRKVLLKMEYLLNCQFKQ